MLKGPMTCILHTVSCAGLNRVMGRSTTMILLLAVLAATPRELHPAVQDPPPDPLPAILKTIAESSRVAGRVRFDPRILASDGRGFVPEALLPLDENRLQYRDSVALAHGFPTGGDAFLVRECDSWGRWTLIQGEDTLIRPTRPPLTPEMEERCRNYRAEAPGRPRVLIQSAPRRVADGWQVIVNIVGDSGGELWEFLFSKTHELVRGRLLFDFHA